MHCRRFGSAASQKAEGTRDAVDERRRSCRCPRGSRAAPAPASASPSTCAFALGGRRTRWSAPRSRRPRRGAFRGRRAAAEQPRARRGGEAREAHGVTAAASEHTEVCAGGDVFAEDVRAGDFAQLGSRRASSPRVRKWCAAPISRPWGAAGLTPSQPQPIARTPGDHHRRRRSVSDCRAVAAAAASQTTRGVRRSRRRRANFCGPPPAASARQQLPPQALPSRSRGRPALAAALRKRRRPAARRAPTSALGPAPALRPAPLRGRARPDVLTPLPPRAPRSPPTRRCGQRRRWAPSSSRTAPSRSGSACARATAIRYNAKRRHWRRTKIGL